MRESRWTAARIVAALLMVTVVAGCGESLVAKRVVGAVPQKEMAAGGASAADRHLAYEHSVGLDVPEDEIAKVSNAAQATCRELAAESCELLNSSLNTGRHSHASLKFRASPAGVRKLISSLGQLGEIVDQSTTAEDLARPLADTARKIAMLTDYRKQLESLRQQARLDADTLIKLTHELAQVQADLEAAQGEQAFLRKRVDLEILHVQIHPLRAGSFWRPIQEAGADFGSNLSHGISSAIVGVAYLLPWGLLLGVMVWLGRVMWRRRRRAGA